MSRSGLLDRVIEAVAPERALRRAQARLQLGGIAAFHGGYIGGDPNRRALKTWRPGGGDANADVLGQLPTLRKFTRDLNRYSPIGGAAINRAVTNVIGSGLRPQPQIDNLFLGLDAGASAAWEDAAAREFKLWSESLNCDAMRQLIFADMQDLAYRSTLENGDCFIILDQVARAGWPYRLALQLYEADQISNPGNKPDGGKAPGGGANKVFGGIERNPRGEDIAVHISSQHPGASLLKGKTTWRRVPIFGPNSGRRQVLHLCPRKRIGQSRGVPFLAPVIEILKQITTYSQAELYAAVIGSMITVVYKSGSGASSLPDVNPDSEKAIDPDTGTEEKSMQPGMQYTIESDDDLEVPSLGRPNPQFNAFFDALTRQVGAVLEIPQEVLIQHFTRSYSASRAALETAWQFFVKARHWNARNLCGPVYEALLEEAVLLQRISAPGFMSDLLIRQAYVDAQWIGPARISLDPAREIPAEKIAQDEGWKTGRQITAERTGGDWDRNHRRRVQEKTQRQADGIEGAAPAGPQDQGQDEGDDPDDPREDFDEEVAAQT